MPGLELGLSLSAETEPDLLRGLVEIVTVVTFVSVVAAVEATVVVT